MLAHIKCNEDTSMCPRYRKYEDIERATVTVAAISEQNNKQALVCRVLVRFC